MTPIDPTLPTTDVVVVGGGLGGLVAAATAARAGRRVLVLEGRELGGRARVDRCNGFLFNRGPRALYRDGAARRVFDGLGVRTDRGGPPDIRGARGLHGDSLQLIPQGPGSLLRTRLLSLREKGRAIPALARLPRMDTSRFVGMSADEAVAALGLGPTASELLRAMVRLSTYCAATDELDGVSAIEQVQMGMTTGAIYLDGGWQSLIDQLEGGAVAAGVEIREGVSVRRVESTAVGTVRVTTGGDGVLDAATVVLATGGPDAAAGLLGRPAASPEALGSPALAACLELGLRRRPTHPFVLGIDEPTYLATHCPPADLAPEGGAVVHVMRYLRADDDVPSQAVRDQLRRLAARAGVQHDDIAEERFLAKMPVTGAMPTASSGRQGRVPVMAADRPGILLAGDWVGAEGLLADAAVASGALAGQLAVERDATLVVA